MPDLYTYIAVFIETLAVLYFWCQLGMDWKTQWKKAVFCVLLISAAACLIINNPMATLIGQFLYVLTVMLIFRKPLKEALIEFAVTMVVLSLIVIIISGILSVFIAHNAYWSYVKLFSLAGVLIAIIILSWLVPIKAIYLKFKPGLEKGILILINSLIVINVINFYDKKLDSNDFLAILLQISAIIAVTYAFAKSITEAKEQESMIRLYQQQSSTITPLIDEIRSRQHDFKNHINTIYGILQSDDEHRSSALQYIESLNASLKGVEMLIPIKDKTIAAIIYSKACEAQAADIDFTYVLPPYEIQFPMQSYEYASVLGNLLDNAFEAPTAEGIKKSVILRMYSNAVSSCLEVSNNGQPIAPEVLSKIFRKGFSTKQSKNTRGYGLNSVKKICDSYSGNIEVLQDGDFTTFRLSFAAASN